MIRYRHRNCDRVYTPATFAYELPPYEAFEKMFTLGEPVINFPFGYTFLHPKDQYEKAVGRAMAEKNLRGAFKQFNLLKIVPRNGRWEFTLEHSFSSWQRFWLTISVDPHAYSTRLEYIEII